MMIVASGWIDGQVTIAPTHDTWAYGVSGASVVLVGPSGRTWKTKTADSGRFQFEGLEPGSYTVTVKDLSIRTVAGSAILFSFSDSPDPKAARVSQLSKPDLRRELLRMVDEDQKVRRDWIAQDASKPNPKAMEAMRALSARQIYRLDRIIATGGWPTPMQVGIDACEAAFMVPQHADPKTQIRYFPVISTAYRAHSVRPPDFAMFTDRVLLAQGKRQRYGSVATAIDKWVNGVPSLEPIEDEANVDKRRAEVGLMPLKDYIAFMAKMYKTPKAGG